MLNGFFSRGLGFSDGRENDSQLGYLRERYDTLQGHFDSLNNTVNGLLDTQVNLPPPPARNLLFNGDAAHSYDTWNNSAAAGGDQGKECAWFYSHTAAGLTGALSSVNANTSSSNSALKSSDHSTYDPLYARWNKTNGWAEMTGNTHTIDILMPANLIGPDTPLARVSLLACKRHSFIEMPQELRMFACIYDNTAGQRKVIEGSLGFTASLVQDTAAASTVERRYKIHVTTDRGFSYLSPEVTVAGAPADGFWGTTRSIVMYWKRVPGQLQVDIYEYLPASGAYRLVEQVSANSSFIHTGSYLSTEGGYPSASGTFRQAIYYSETGEMAALAVKGEDAVWSTVNFPIAVPDDYNKGNTTDRQWVRIGMTSPPNLYAPYGDGVGDGTSTFYVPANFFDAEYAALYPGVIVALYNSAGTEVWSGTISAYLSDGSVQLSSTVPAGAYAARFHYCGFHGVYVDKVHLGYHQNTAYAPNDQDTRGSLGQQPAAAPPSADQGTVGVGGSGGGIVYCVAEDTPVKTASGARKMIGSARPGDLWEAPGQFAPNLLLKLRRGFEKVRPVTSENGLYIECTDTERFVTSRTDHKGTQLRYLRKGDTVLAEIGGRVVETRIKSIGDYLPRKKRVCSPTLSSSRLFVAGRRSGMGLADRVRAFAARLLAGEDLSAGGFVLHNRKVDEALDLGGS